MIIKDLYIDNIKWHVRIFYAVTCYFTDQIIQELEAIECPQEKIESARKNMAACKLNTGLTYSNNDLRETVMVIGMWSSPAEFDNSFAHELRHFSDHIANAFNLKIGGEDIAYFTGELRQRLYPVNKNFLCDCHQNHKEIFNRIFQINT